ncbi:hypothetical protein KC909_02315 [Candidatus Dojkabacteria bacterium]|uniref:Uncharacterized protein n=1 Tax=Candidatus Dojkabacteria bacterium TaxID=2099670 RepID=A0A955L5Q0_9BACT|nr:hypothetical protein [Candidatus Dojkabacteria bacterium]
MKNTQTTSKKGSRLVPILFGLLIIFVVLQLYILTSVGTQGERVSQVRNEQAEIKIENEITRAKILELQSNGAVAETVENLQMNPATVKYIDINYQNISAQE